MRLLKTATAVALYLAAIVAANQIIQAHGKAAVLYVGAGLIAFNLVARDLLHDLFGKGRLWKMALLIATGSLLSYLLNADAAQIAKASALAFGASEAIDGLLYHVLRLRPWLERSNASNVVSASVDTIVFFTVAFHALPFKLVFAQIACKIAGGVVYSLALQRRREVLPRHA